MRYCADTSALLRLYLATKDAAVIERFLTDNAKVISVSELSRVEVINVLLRARDARLADEFERDLAEGRRLRLESVDWPDTFQQAESLARRFSSTLRPGAHDLVLVAAAVAMGATWFLSFDQQSHQRALAAAAGLRVWPPLSKEEKGLFRLASTPAAS